MSKMPKSLPNPGYVYETEVALMEERLQKLTELQKDEVHFFDNKLNIALGLFGGLLLGHGASVETLSYFGTGETGTVYDAGIAVWNEKTRHNLIRPITVVQHLYPDREFTLWNDTRVQGKYFQPLIRVMPHSEYPSGSSCMCQAVADFVDELFPTLGLNWPDVEGVPDFLRAQPVDKSNIAMYPVIPPNTAMPFIPGTGNPNPSAAGYTTAALSERCGTSRLEGGMHFTASVPDGRELCKDLGANTAKSMSALISGDVKLLAGTKPCGSPETCTSVYDAPWFDVVSAREATLGPLPPGATGNDMPFALVDRNHILMISMMASTIPSISKYETTIQLRVTNTMENLFWNSVAAFSPEIKAVHFGQDKLIGSPTVQNLDPKRHTTDARLMTAANAFAAAFPLLLPEVGMAFKKLLPCIWRLLAQTETPGEHGHRFIAGGCLPNQSRH